MNADVDRHRPICKAATASDTERPRIVVLPFPLRELIGGELRILVIRNDLIEWSMHLSGHDQTFGNAAQSREQRLSARCTIRALIILAGAVGCAETAVGPTLNCARCMTAI